MDLALSAEEEDLVAAFDALLAKESSTSRVRAAERLGFDPALWSALTELGVPDCAVGPEAATTGQLVLIAEVAGRHLAAAPLVESLVTARLLGRSPADLTTLVLHPITTMYAELVPAGAVAQTVIAYDGSALTAFTSAPPMVAARNVGGLPLADRVLADGTVIATGEPARTAFETARRDWQLLTAAQLVGLAARALEITVEYVRERKVFGRAVGSFQTVSATLADHATAVDGARLLAREAAWACDVGDPRGPALATMAFCFAAEQAVAVAGDGLHFHGGYGFTLEYDIQLYYRRAQAYPLVWGSVRREYHRLADRLWGRP